jgi:hypothetical protein
MISDILDLYKFVSKELESASVLKALFSWNGTKKSGSDKIKIQLHGNPASDKHWFYEVLPYENFIFTPIPVNPSVNVDFGKAENDKNPDSKYFRYVSSPLAKVMAGGEENVKVDFMVFGYVPEDLMNKISSNKDP